MAINNDTGSNELKMELDETAAYPRFRWLVLLALFLVTMSSNVIMISPAPLMGIIAKSFNMSLGDTTACLMGLFNLVVAISCLGGGIACDRIGLFPVMLFSSIILTLSTAALPFAGQSLEAMLVLRMLQASGCGSILATVSPVAALWFPIHERGIVTGIQGMAVSMGIAIGFVAAPGLYAALGDWRVATGWLGSICLLAFVVTVVIALVPKPVVPASIGDIYEMGHEGANNLKLAFKQPVTWIGVFVVFCLMWVLNAFNDLTPAFLAIEPPLGVGYGPMMAGKMMMVLEIAFMAGAVTTGFVMERMFKGEVRPVIAFGFFMFAIASASIIFPVVHGNIINISLCLVMAGFFQAWVVPNAMAFISMHYPPHINGKLVGMWMGLGIFGGTAGVVCGSIALRVTGNYHLSIIIVSIVALIGSVASLFLKPPTVFVPGENAEISTGRE